MTQETEGSCCPAQVHVWIHVKTHSAWDWQHWKIKIDFRAMFKSLNFQEKPDTSRTCETILRHVRLVNPSLYHQWKQAAYWQVKQMRQYDLHTRCLGSWAVRKAPPLIIEEQHHCQRIPQFPNWCMTLAWEYKTKHYVNNYTSSVKGEEDHGKGSYVIA